MVNCSYNEWVDEYRTEQATAHLLALFRTYCHPIAFYGNKFGTLAIAPYIHRYLIRQCGFSAHLNYIRFRICLQNSTFY